MYIYMYIYAYIFALYFGVCTDLVFSLRLAFAFILQPAPGRFNRQHSAVKIEKNRSRLSRGSAWQMRGAAFRHGKNFGKGNGADGGAGLISNQDSAGSERCSWAFAMKINQARVGPPGVFPFLLSSSLSRSVSVFLLPVYPFRSR